MSETRQKLEELKSYLNERIGVLNASEQTKYKSLLGECFESLPQKESKSVTDEEIAMKSEEYANTLKLTDTLHREACIEDLKAGAKWMRDNISSIQQEEESDLISLVKGKVGETQTFDIEKLDKMIIERVEYVKGDDYDEKYKGKKIPVIEYNELLELLSNFNKGTEVKSEGECNCKEVILIRNGYACKDCNKLIKQSK